jgi:RNA polymerase sigma-70 factor (ECF subfamily)
MTAREPGRDAVADAFRAEWPRILATLIRMTGSVELAEDSVQEAFERALVARDRALLINPAAWITTVARRIALDALRRDATLRARLPRLLESADAPWTAHAPAGDDRLGLVFLACAPELTPETRLALALRFVCGVPTEAIADALLVQHTAMSARLTRAKRRIEDEGIRFADRDPDRDAREQDRRLDDVLSTVYVLYTTAHAAPSGSPIGADRRTAATAIELARALRRLRPTDPEVAGLLALLLLTDARAGGRFADDGRLATLEIADRRSWDRAAIEQGIALATTALPGGGRYALQAGIAGLHAEAQDWAATDWAAIGTLYDRLIAVWPSPAVAVARIVARSYGPGGPEQALAELDAIGPDPAGAAGRQLLAVRADLLRRSGRGTEARATYVRAIGVEPHEQTRTFFAQRIAELDGQEAAGLSATR